MPFPDNGVLPHRTVATGPLLRVGAEAWPSGDKGTVPAVGGRRREEKGALPVVGEKPWPARGIANAGDG